MHASIRLSEAQRISASTATDPSKDAKMVTVSTSSREMFLNVKYSKGISSSSTVSFFARTLWFKTTRVDNEGLRVDETSTLALGERPEPGLQLTKIS